MNEPDRELLRSGSNRRGVMCDEGQAILSTSSQSCWSGLSRWSMYSQGQRTQHCVVSLLRCFLWQWQCFM